MNFATIRSFVIRNRVSLQDLGILIAALVVATYIAFDIDIFMHEGQLTPARARIEIDEIAILGVFLAVGLLIFGGRRYREQKREVKRRMAAEAHARELAYQDVLTGLPNRRQFDEVLKTALASPPRAGAAHALYLLDLNGFKQVNDVHGHSKGDEVLIVVGQRLRSAMRDGDMVARFGGDEFAILAHHLAGSEAAANVALRVIEALKAPILGGDAMHHVGAGIGIALLPQDADTPEEAMRKADVALYRAKAERRSALRFFEAAMDEHVHEREAMERALRHAIEAGDIMPVFRPTFDLGTHAVVGFEASPRWVRAEHGEIPPERFIAIAEEAGLIHELADHLLRTACIAAVEWPAHVRLSIDIVPSQLKDELLAARIVRILHETGVSAERLEVEITESAIVADLEAARRTFGTLRGAGVRIALDNFGTGYSSLYHLRSFKLDKIKIDRSFIEAMRSESESASIVNALVGLGHGLGLTIAAEGIQDSEQERELLGTGCEQGQGDLLSQPMPAAATLNFFAGITGRDHSSPSIGAA
ncbi:putative bifunctional diguanylate cyclase/phosphodiesterase [Sphingobium sp. YR768]|uniref:putative bifunctional diguanylate cyclase/phosphodiesterase n=1 Tax=Sphingobium sp. YR768 TaxID=1884365 RepID=UPI0008C89F0A|nr:EAL domain-containing protein [Sphingobium sp. YR768]SES11812.1 diguanylate cyclase (GGDEF) domain-containing protein [Sphingobium sp. YR768]